MPHPLLSATPLTWTTSWALWSSRSSRVRAAQHTARRATTLFWACPVDSSLSTCCLRQTPKCTDMEINYNLFKKTTLKKKGSMITSLLEDVQQEGDSPELSDFLQEVGCLGQSFNHTHHAMEKVWVFTAQNAGSQKERSRNRCIEWNFRVMKTFPFVQYPNTIMSGTLTRWS